MLWLQSKGLNKLSEIITNCEDISAPTGWGWRDWADKIYPNVVPRRNHRNRMELWSYCFKLSATLLTYITSCDLHACDLLIQCTNIIACVTSFTSLVIPGQINLSVILDSVLFHPMCPDVGCLWQESMIFFLSRGSIMKRTYADAETILNIIM